MQKLNFTQCGVWHVVRALRRDDMDDKKTPNKTSTRRIIIGSVSAVAILAAAWFMVGPTIENKLSYESVLRHSVGKDLLVDRLANGAAIDPKIGENPSLTMESNKTLLVKYTLVDSTAIASDETIDSLWTGSVDDMEAKIYGQYSANAALYRIAGNNDYYAAFVDATQINSSTSTGKIQDWCVAYNDGKGRVIEDAFYDVESGVAYIPVRAFEANEPGAQIQLMKPIDLEDTTETVHVSVYNNRPGFEAADDSNISVDSIEPELTIPVADPAAANQISRDNIELFANDLYVNLSDDNSSYDPESGYLTVCLNSMGITDVEVKINKDNAGGLLSNLFEPSKAYGYTLYESSIPFYNGGDTYFDKVKMDQVTAGTSFRYSANMTYNIGINSWSGDYGMSTGMAGGPTDDQTTAISYYSWGSLQDSASPWYTVSSSPSRMMTMDGIFDKTVNGVNFHTVGSYTRLLLECSHVSSPVGDAGFQNPGDSFSDTGFMRVMKSVENGAWSYIIAGFVSPQTNSQSCSAVYKFRIKAGLKIEMTKSSRGNNALGIANGAGVSATYGVYSDAACTNRVSTLSTNSNGKGEVTLTEPGTYYLKEISASWPHFVDSANNPVITVSGDLGQTVKASAKNTSYSQLNLIKYKLPPSGTITVDDIALGGKGRADLKAEISNNTNVKYTITIHGAADAGTVTCTLPAKLVYSGGLTPGGTISSDNKTVTISNTSSDKVVSFNAQIPIGWSNGSGTAVSLLNVRTSRTTASLTTGMTNATLEGATYTIYKNAACTSVVGTCTTDSSGRARYGYNTGEALVPGTKYYVKETVPADYYDLNPTVYEFTASTNNSAKAVTVSVGDSWHSMRIEKRSEFPNYTRGRSDFSLGGAQYDIWYGTDPRNLQDFPPTWTKTTDANGNIFMPDADPGTYWIRESSPSKGYIVNPTWYSATVKDNEQAVVRVSEWIPVSLTIIKNSASTVPNIPAYSLAGATFKIYGSQADANADTNALFDPMVTDASGKTQKQTIPMGNYWIRETTAPAGYNKNPNVFAVTANQFANNANQTISVSETPRNMTVAPSKTASAATREVPIFNSLAGATIAIYPTYADAQAKTNAIATRTTSADGTCEPFTNLPPQKQYFVRELSAPATYLVNQNIHTVTFGNSLTEPVSIDETGHPVNIKITKSVVGNNGAPTPPIEGAEFAVYTSQMAAANRGDDYVAKRTSDANGECEIISNLPARRYWVSELRAPEGYYLTYDPVEAVFDDTSTFTANVNIEEEPILVEMKIAKRSANANATPDTNSSLFSYQNAQFGIYKTYAEALGATNANQGSPIAVVSTDSTGLATWRGYQPPGIYYAKELVAPTGYVLAPGVYSVEAVATEGTPTRAAAASVSSTSGSQLLSTRLMMNADEFANTGIPSDNIVYQDEDVIISEIPITDETGDLLDKQEDIFKVTDIVDGDVEIHETTEKESSAFEAQEEYLAPFAKDIFVEEDENVLFGYTPNDTNISVMDQFVAKLSDAEASISGEALRSLFTEMNVFTEEGADSFDDRIKIAVIDTGVSEEYANMRATVLDDGVFGDCNGHGTEIARTILSKNPDAYIISIRAFDSSGHASTEAVYSAIKYAIECDADLINMSFAANAENGSSVLEEILSKASNNGIALLAAAGNYSSDVAAYIPASIGCVVAVGASDADGNPRDFSNYGDNVRIWETAESTSEACAIASGKASTDVGAFNTEYPAWPSLQPAEDDGTDAVFEVQATKEFTYNANSKIQSWPVPWDGSYTFEAWGAQGGANASGAITPGKVGGKGGYAKGTKTLSRSSTPTLYGVPGGQGSTYKGGYNGGGNACHEGSDSNWFAGGGGGATHIGVSNAVLKSTTKANVIIVGGGGGGASETNNGGTGGGATGGNGGGKVGWYGYGGTQTAGGANPETATTTISVKPGYGQGGYGAALDWEHIASGATVRCWAGGGGGGLYGGSAGSWSSNGSSSDLSYGGGGGGGSGYVGGLSSTTNSNGSRSGNGYAKITYTPTQTVKFNANGGTGSMADQSYTMGTAQKLRANAYTLPAKVTYNLNYSGAAAATTVNVSRTFAGWAESASGAVKYSNQQSVTNPAGNTMGASKTLYAKWNSTTVTLPSRTRTGYTFDGWYTAASGGTKVGNAGATYTFNPALNSTLNLYAHWTAKNYTVHFDSSGGTGTMTDQTMQVDIAANIKTNAFSKTNCTFLGWSLTKPAAGTRVPHVDYTNGQSVKNLTTTVGATVTLYAVWKSNITTVADATMVYEAPQSTSIRVVKKISGTLPPDADFLSDYSLAGAIFGVYSTQAAADAATPSAPGSPVARITTDDAGTGIWSDAVVGTNYWLKEIQAPTCGKYNVNTSTFATGSITSNVVKDVQVTEAVKTTPGYLTITKSIGDGRAPLVTASGTWDVAGTVFGVYKTQAEAEDISSTPYTTLTIGTDGSASVRITSGTYYVRELSSPTAMALDSTIRTVTVTDGNTSTLSVTDTPLMIKIGIAKTNASPGTTADSPNEYSLEGAVFGIYKTLADANANTNAVDTLTTDANGNASIDGLYPQVYYIKEITPPTNFTPDDTVYTTANDVSAAGQVITVPNEPQVAYIDIRKSSDYDITAFPGSSLAGASFGIYSAESCTDDTLIDTLVVNDAGEARSNALAPSIYWVKEIHAPDGFELNTQVFPADLTSVSNIAINIEDHFPVGKISVVKVSNHPEWINNDRSGVVFAIYSDEECETQISYMETDAEGNAVSEDLKPGTYWVKEAIPLTSHGIDDTVYAVNVTDGTTTPINDGQPIVNETTSVILHKTSTDSEMADKYPLEGAVYGVYNDPNFDTQSLVGSITTDANGDGSLNLLPPGDYYIKELFAPFGYTVSEEEVAIQLQASGPATVEVQDEPRRTANTTLPFQIIKSNDEDGTLSNGTFTVEGAEFTVEFYTDLLNAEQVLTASPDRTWILRIDENGIAELDDDHKVAGDEFYYADEEETKTALLDGTLLITESTAPAGYEISNDKWLYHIEDSLVYDENNQEAPSIFINVPEAPKRADVRFAKTDANATPMANMPFLISLMDGVNVIESHVVFTDANGVFDSSTALEITEGNANDDLIYFSDDKTYIPSVTGLTSETRLWFAGSGESTSEPIAGRGSLPFGTYRVQELESPDNGHYELPGPITFTVNDESGAVVDIGTFVNTEIEITSTVARDATTGIASGSLSSSYISDIVSYSGLIPGQTYTFIGGAYDVETGEPIHKSDDTALASIITLEATQADGQVEMKYYLANYDITGRTIGITTRIERDNIVKAEHNADLQTISQRVSYPKIGTTALAANGTHEGLAQSHITLTDAVAYENLDTNREYTLVGTLHRASLSEGNIVDAGAYTDAQGNAVTVRKTFTPTSADGTETLEFSFDNGLVDIGDLVVFETLIDSDNKTVAEHADITDAAQTITYPFAATTATDSATGQHQGVFNDGKTNITDVVAYKHLDTTKTYTLTGSLVDGADGTPLTIEGAPITATTTFTPESRDGSITLTFTNIPKEVLTGKVAVVYEEIRFGDNIIAEHKDLSDTNQMVSYGNMQTTATDAATSLHVGLGGVTSVNVIDQVAYNGLVPGQSYTLTGIAYNKADDSVMKNTSNADAIVTKTFVPENASGTVALSFALNAPQGDFTVVIGEVLTMDGGGEVATHVDMNDESQSVHYPTIATTATDDDTHDHEGANDTHITVRDTVTYRNLIPGQTYTVVGELMDKQTGTPVTADNGTAVTATSEFTPESANGTTDVVFVFDKTATENKTIVVFERLYSAGMKIAEHASIDDADQSVFFPKVRTSAKDAATGNSVGSSQGTATIIDTVSYDNLIVGHEYTLTGKLMDADTGEVLKNGANEITATASFTPTTTSGTTTVTFTFPASAVAGKTAVVFEYLYRNGYMIGSHADLTDTGQTIYYPAISTTAKDNATALHVGRIDDSITIVDTVVYSHLAPGLSYTLTATLYSKSGTALLTSGGSTITGTKTFTPTAASGTEDVTITFPATALPNGDTLVAYESLVYANTQLAIHENPDDAAQTIYYPKIGTTAVDSVTTGHAGSSTSENVTITDTIAYSNLLPGTTYTVSTILKGKDGTTIPSQVADAYKTFTPTTPSGTFDVVITAAAANLEGKDAVVFENISIEGKIVAIHEDLSDTSQTVSYPKIRTTATDTTTAMHEGLAQGTVSITDVVSYENLVPGDNYTLTGTLYDKTLGRLVVDAQARPISASITVTPQSKNGTASLVITCDSALVAGHDIVVFENLYDNEDHPVAKHEAPDDASQMVSYPAVSTLATGTVADHGGLKDIPANRHIALIDEVSFSNLEPHATYKVSSVFVYKGTGQPFTDHQGNVMSKEETFVPDTANGTYTVTFPDADAYNFDGVELVAYEKLYRNGKLVAQHEDLADTGQTIKFTEASDKVSVPQAGSRSQLFLLIIGFILMGAAAATAIRRATRKSYARSLNAKVGGATMLFTVAIAMTMVFASGASAASLEVKADGGDYSVYRLLEGEVDHVGRFSFDEKSFPSSNWQDVTGQPTSSPDDILSWMEEETSVDPEGAARRIGGAAAQHGTPVTTIAANKEVQLEDGYYAVCSTGTVPALLKLSGTDRQVISAKRYDIPKVTKRVISPEDAIDFTVGEPIIFGLVGTIPSDYARYKEFYYAFVDESSPTLIVDEHSVNVVWHSPSGDIDVTDKAIISSENDILLIEFDDLREALPELEPGDTLLAKYSASLDPETVVPGMSEPVFNRVSLRFGAVEDNLIESYDSGETQLTAYTYRLTVTKHDSKDPTHKLSGAEFAIRNKSGGYYTGNGWTADLGTAKKFYTDEAGKFSIVGLGSGTYYLVETTAPTGYESSGETELVIEGHIPEGGNLKVDVAIATPNAGGSSAVEDINPAAGDIVVSIGDNATASVPISITGDTFPYIGTALVMLIAAVAIAIRRKTHERRQ